MHCSNEVGRTSGTMHLIEYSRLNSIGVRFSDSVDRKIIHYLSCALPDPSSRSAPSHATVLKSARQRLVYRWQPSLECRSVVAKTFPLSSIFSMIRYKKYAFSEFQNAITARRLGIPIPEVYCYFERRRLGFVVGSGLIYEDVGRFDDVLAWSLKLPGGYEEAAGLAIPAIVALFVSGVNHVDMRDENILLAREGHGMDFRLIDWQYASFVRPRADWLLEHLCAYFIRKAPVCNQAALLEEWCPRVLIAATSSVSSDLFERRVRLLLKKMPSTRSRLQLLKASSDQIGLD